MCAGTVSLFKQHVIPGRENPAISKVTIDYDSFLNEPPAEIMEDNLG
jgi:hypothetical protein